MEALDWLLREGGTQGIGLLRARRLEQCRTYAICSCVRMALRVQQIRRFDPTIHTTPQCIALTNHPISKLLSIFMKIIYKYIDFNFLFIYIYSQIYK